MQLREVLRTVDGVNRRFIYYLESQGYIRPGKIRKRRISRRDYSPEDVQTVREVWRYYTRGISVQNAYEMASRAQRNVTYVLFDIPPKQWQRTLDLLRSHDQVMEAGVVYGTDRDAVAKISTALESDVYHVLEDVFARSGVASVPTLLRVKEYVVGKEGNREGREDSPMLAYVLLRAPAKQIAEVLEQLRSFPGVVEAGAIYGETDVIAKVQVSGQDELDQLVMGKIHGIPSVESTRTFIVIGSMHWSR